MNIRYAHTNIVAADWKKLADFYIAVFGCTPVPPERDLQGEWLDKGSGLENAHLKGLHLRLPGHGDNGPTLEIFQYSEMLETAMRAGNKKGYSHIAFQAEDVAALLEIALEHGATKLGEISGFQIEGAGYLTFIYIADPEGNVIELQNWK